jgi:hypothetical protein
VNRQEFLLKFDFPAYVTGKFPDMYATSDEDRVRVHCPFCSDKKGHLYILLSAGLPYCQRCKYDPKSPLKFISDLEGVSMNEVFSMADGGAFMASSDLDVDALVDALFEEDEESVFTYKDVELGRSFVPVLETVNIPHVDNMLMVSKRYLNSRGVGDSTIAEFDMRFCYEGRYSGRIVVPCYYRGSIVTFVARDLFGTSDRKYLNPMGNKQSDFLFNLDSVKDDVVVLTEGVFDAIKVSEIVPSVASFGKSLSRRQIEMLNGFKTVVFYWDLDAYPQVEKYARRIQAECHVVLHSDGKDAGARTNRENEELLKNSVPVDSVVYQMFKMEYLS